MLSDETKVRNIDKTKKSRKLEKKWRGLQRQVSSKYQMNKKGDSYCKTRNLIKSEKRILRIHRRLADIRQEHVHQAAASIMERKKRCGESELSQSASWRHQASADAYRFVRREFKPLEHYIEREQPALRDGKNGCETPLWEGMRNGT